MGIPLGPAPLAAVRVHADSLKLLDFMCNVMTKKLQEDGVPTNYESLLMLMVTSMRFSARTATFAGMKKQRFMEIASQVFDEAIDSEMERRKVAGGALPD